MLTAALNRRIQSIVLFCVIAMTLLVTPWMNLDPINLPKFLVLVVCGFVVAGYLATSLGRLIRSEVKLTVYFALSFILSLFLISVINQSFLQIYGSYGRNTGLLSYLSLTIILLAASSVADIKFVNKLVWSLILTGILNAAYGLIQWADLDPVEWNNPYNPIAGTLGNPNFTSAHLGIASLASLAMLLGHASGRIKIVSLANIVLSIFVAYNSDSSQGLLIFGFGATVIIYLKFVRQMNSFIRYGYWFLLSMISAFGVFGILNKGPLAKILYQESVTFRGDYWRAGWNMTFENPFFGIGLDAYGDWYRTFRTEAAATRRGPDVTSNSAHNVFLDISTSGGLFLLIPYLLILGLVIRSAMRILYKSANFDPIGVGLAVGWFAYLIQSTISINQLGLAIWGWVLGGAIIGYDRCQSSLDLSQEKRTSKQRQELVPASTMLTGAVGLLLGLILSIWPVAKDASYRSALESGDPAKIENVAARFPQKTFYYTYAAKIFLDNKLEDKSLEMAKKAIIINDRDFNAYKALVANPKASEADKEMALAKMQELDPFNNTLDK